jgi:hypothetical protein
VPFELARVLRAAGDDPVPFEDAAAGFFARVGLDPAGGWAGVVSAWDTVRTPAGCEPWAEAVAAARARPRAFRPDVGRLLAPYATAAWHLSLFHRGRPFPFPVKNVAEAFGLSVATAARTVNALVAVRVLAVVDPTYSYTDRKARTFRFVAAPVAEPGQHGRDLHDPSNPEE